MKKLKEVIDEFGWGKIQQGQFPPEIKTEKDNFAGGVHQYDLYALNGVCVVVEDEKQIVELSGISKTSSGYDRTAQIPQNTVVRVQDAAAYLAGFKHIHKLRSVFLFERSENMHFDGIGKRIEDAGELFHGE